MLAYRTQEASGTVEEYENDVNHVLGPLQSLDLKWGTLGGDFGDFRHKSVFTCHIKHIRYLCLIIICSKFLPHSPTWNANSLDNTDHHLGHEDEEESHKVEGAVGPAQRE